MAQAAPGKASLLDDEPDVADVARDLKGAASDLKSAAKEQGRALYETARSEATSFVDQRKNDAAQSVADIASSLRGTGEAFEGRPNIRAIVDSAADGLETLADGLRERSFADIYGDVEAYARRSPLAVGAMALAAGFLVARFIKSTSEDLSEKAREASAPKRTAARRAPPPDDAEI